MPHIAVIDDEKIVNDMHKKVLENAGMTVSQYLTKVDAIEALKRADQFDAIVLDMEMEDGSTDGLEVIRETLLSMERDQELCPILVVSGLKDPAKYRDITMSLGVFDYLEKPLNNTSLIRKMKMLLAAVKPSSSQTNNATELKCGELHLNLIQPHKSMWRGKRLNMPYGAWCLVARLVRNAGQIVPFGELFEDLKAGKNKANLRTHIANAKNAFKSIDHEFDQIVAITGRGYTWELDKPNSSIRV